MAEEKKITQFQVSGEDPLQAVAPMYSNFVGISRVRVPTSSLSLSSWT